MKTLTMSRTQVFVGDGPLAEIADRATEAGFTFLSVQGKVFRVESGRAAGSSLGLSRVRAVSLVE